jgi:hypothetical protein
MSMPAELEDFGALRELVLKQLTPEERARSAAYLDNEPRPAGQTQIGGQEVQLDQARIVAFIDQRPGANWTHPCRYLLISPTTREITPVSGDRPPIFGVLPPTWRLVWRASGLADWRLLPMSVPHPANTQNEEKKNP